MPRRQTPKKGSVFALVLLLLLSLFSIPALPGFEVLVGRADPVEVQRDASVCQANGNNWTSCDDASASNNLYAQAEDGVAERGSITPITVFQDTTQSATSTSLVDANAETAALANGVPYLVIYSGSHGGSDNNAISILVLEFGTTVIARGQGEGRGTDNHWDSGQTAGFYAVVGDGTSTLRFRFRCDSAAETCYVGALAIIALPLDLLTPMEDFWFSGQNGDTWVLSDVSTGSWTNLLTATWDLPETGEYIVLMSGEGRSNNQDPVEAARMRFLANGTVLGSDYHQEWEDDRDSHNFAKAQVVNLPAGSQTFEVECRSRTDPEADFRRARIVVLRAAAFHRVLQTTNSSGDQTTSTSFVDFSGLDTTYTPALAQWALILANAVLGSSSDAAPAELRDDTAGVSYRVNGGEMENDVGFGSGRDQQPTLLAHAAKVNATTTWKVRYRADPGGTAVIGRNADNTAGIRSDLIVWGLSLPGPGRNDTAWKNFGLDLNDNDEVQRVEVGVEWFRNSVDPALNVTVSWDGGVSWATNQTATNKSVDNDALEWLDFTSATTWTASALRDANFRVRAGTNASGARLDYLTVRIMYLAPPEVSNFRWEDGSGQSSAGEVLDPAVPYYFLFNVTDRDGWADIGADGGVALHLWYDGGAAPELNYTQQTNGSDYRVDLRYTDTADPGNATLSEWTLLEGSATYDASASNLTEIYAGPTLIGYEFVLSLTLDFSAKAASDPTNSTIGGYDDPDSWNAEVTADDGFTVTTLQTASTGEHMEFGLFARPLMNYTQSASPTVLEPGDTTVFQVDFVNNGQGPANVVWVNVTLPPELLYVTDDAASIGGSSACCYNFAFPNVDPGAYTFNITTSAASGVSNGTVATVNFAYAASDTRDRPVNLSAADESVLIVNGVLTYQVTRSTDFLRPGEAVVFQVEFENTGDGNAGQVWVNMTLPAPLGYISDDAAAIGGVRSGAYSFAFTDVAPGLYIFNITAEANAGVPNGTIATTDFAFAALDPIGGSLGTASEEESLTILNSRLTATLTISAPTADPGDALSLELTVRNVGEAAARNIVIRAALDPQVIFLSATPGGTYLPATHTVRWTFAQIAPGEGVVLQWTVEVVPGSADRSLLGFATRVDYTDLSETMPPLFDSAGAAVTAPVFAPAFVFDQTLVERGDEIVATLYFNNTGTGVAGFAWANWSLNGHYELLSLTPPLPSSATDGGFAVAWTNLPPGSASLEARLRVARGMTDGLVMELQVEWTATDSNGNLVSAATPTQTAVLRAPEVSVEATAAQGDVASGSVFTLAVKVRNVGQAPAMAWLNLSLPEGITYEGDDGAYPVDVAGGTVSWSLAAVPAGSDANLEVQLSGQEGLDTVSLQFTADFTDGRGSPPETVQSQAVSIRIIAPGSGFPWWLLFVAIAGIGAAAFLAYRRRSTRVAPQEGGPAQTAPTAVAPAEAAPAAVAPAAAAPPRKGVTVEQVFVVDHGGKLIAHRSNSIIQPKDKDLVAGMLTAVQSYVRDVFSDSEGDAIRYLELGDRKIHIEQGSFHYIAVVYRGEDGAALATRAAEVSQQIEKQFSDTLLFWNGDMDEVKGIGGLLPRLWEEDFVAP